MSGRNHDSEVRICVERSFYPDAYNVSLSLLNQPGLGGFAVAEEVKFRAVDPESAGLIHEPTIRLKHAELADLAEQLWRLGFRPAVAVDQATVIEAQRAHIEDLRGSHSAVLAMTMRRDGTGAP